MEPSTDALLGFELVGSGTYLPRILACCTGSARAGLWQMSSDLVLKSAAPSDTQCLCSDYDVNFTVFSRMPCSLLQRVISRDRGIQQFMPQTRLFPGWELRLSLRHTPWSRVRVQFRNAGDSRGQCVLPRNHLHCGSQTLILRVGRCNDYP